MVAKRANVRSPCKLGNALARCQGRRAGIRRAVRRANCDKPGHKTCPATEIEDAAEQTASRADRDSDNRPAKLLAR